MKVSPIFFIVLFQLLTLALYYIGPIDYWGKPRTGTVAFYVVIYLLLLVVGYLAAGRLFMKVKGKSWRAENFLYLSSAVILVFSALDLSVALSFEGDLGESYSAALESTNGVIYQYFKMFFAPYLFGNLPVLLFKWREVGAKARYISVFALLLSVLVSVLAGINKVVFSTIIIMTCVFLLDFKLRKLLTFRWAVSALAIAVLFIGASNYFVLTQLSRSGSPAVSGIDSKMGYTSKYTAEDGKLFVFMSAMTSYLSQGYRAFDLALDLPYEPTYGIGHSTFASRQVDRLAGTSIQERSYPARIEKLGWDRYIYWSTFYVWWASDITFWGVGFLMFGIGWTFKVVQNGLHAQGDICSAILFAYLCLMLFYLSANNQIFQAGEGFIGFISVVAYVLFTRKLSILRGGSS